MIEVVGVKLKIPSYRKLIANYRKVKDGRRLMRKLGRLMEIDFYGISVMFWMRNVRNL
jgi:hypothetical protein